MAAGATRIWRDLERRRSDKVSLERVSRMGGPNAAAPNFRSVKTYANACSSIAAGPDRQAATVPVRPAHAILASLVGRCACVCRSKPGLGAKSIRDDARQLINHRANRDHFHKVWAGSTIRELARYVACSHPGAVCQAVGAESNHANPLDLPCQTVCWAPQATKATALWSFRWGADSFAGTAGVRCQQTRAAPRPMWKWSSANLASRKHRCN